MFNRWMPFLQNGAYLVERLVWTWWDPLGHWTSEWWDRILCVPLYSNWRWGFANMLMTGILFSLMRSYNIRVFNAHISDAFDALLPYCYGSRPYRSSACIIAILPKHLLWSLYLISNRRISCFWWGLKLSGSLRIKWSSSWRYLLEECPVHHGKLNRLRPIYAS